MRGSTAKIINYYARESGQEKSRRAFKRTWNGLSREEKRQLRQQLLKTNKQLAQEAKVKAEIIKTRSVRRHEAIDGTKVLWFASDQTPGEATIYMMNGSTFWSARISDGVPDDFQISPVAFEKFWSYAVQDALPAEHLAQLPEFIARRPTLTESIVPPDRVATTPAATTL